ncbi:hypothetical protein F2P56_025477, partial [Juglans regia]
RMWDPSIDQGKLVPLNIDKRYVMLRDSSGFYSYAIYEHLEEWPAFNIDNTRIAFKLREDMFRYMAIADNRQRFMPLPEDRLADRGQALAYPEAVLLVNPVEPDFKGEVDDKYQYSCENKDNRVHGWISNNPSVGFWQITASDEFRSGGPLKQCLTSHVGPTTLAIFHSVHYSGEDLVLKFGPNEPWKKVFGPVFIFLNSLTDGDDPLLLWEDAKQQGHLHTYRFCDNVWTFILQGATFKSEECQETVSQREMVARKKVGAGLITCRNFVTKVKGLKAAANVGYTMDSESFFETQYKRTVQNSTKFLILYSSETTPSV